MQKKLWVGLLCMAVALMAARRDYDLEDRSTVNHTFSGDKTFDVDLINGSIDVTGDGSNTIRVTGERIIRAASRDQIDRAKRDDVLDMNEKEGTAQIYENGPFRDGNNHTSDNHGFHERNDHEYEVTWNLTVHVPREMALHLRSVNGHIDAHDTSGAYDIRAVNGPINLTGIAGSGNISTVNGPNTITFRENPKSDSVFTSVNGKVDVAFQPNLSADFNLKTVNGGMFTDFESTMLASTGKAEQENGKFVYRRRGESDIRVGSGGPKIRIETVNGSIQIRKEK
ncbi:MAG TPA: hypothetical protein VHC90_05065 [Bryobacteraceae bacterium]|nr:hypothetical protein [Bryobacteraceae bacterium]